VEGYAGDFSLATPVGGHRAGTTVRVKSRQIDPSRLVLDFGDQDQVQVDACVLLCGHVGALGLLEVGYTGPLVRRPRPAPVRGSNASRGRCGSSTTEPTRS
jgi:hypothetical protein